MIIRIAVAASLLLLQVQDAPGTGDRTPDRVLKVPAGPGRPAFELRVRVNAGQGVLPPGDHRSAREICDALGGV